MRQVKIRESYVKSGICIVAVILVSIIFSLRYAYATDIFVTQGVGTTEFLPTVTVGSSNGQNYDIIADQPFLLKAFIGGSCDKPIKKAGILITEWPGSAQNAILTMPPLSKDMPLHEVVLPNGLIAQTSAIQMPDILKNRIFHACYTKMVETGLPKDEAFAEPYMIEGFEFGTLSGYMHCYNTGDTIEIAPNYSKTFPAHVNIVCNPFTLPGGIAPPPGIPGAPRDITQVVHVTGSSLKAIANTENGKCEVKINAVIETDGQAEISYLFENEQGTQSVVRSVNVGSSHKAEFKETYDMTNTGEVPGFAPPPGDSPSGPSYSSTPTGNIQGYFKMIGVSHPFESDVASYNLNCEEPPEVVDDMAEVYPSEEKENQRIQPAQVAVMKLPDLVYSDGMQIGGVNGNWGGLIRLTSSKAVSSGNGYCTYNYIVHVKNIGNAATGEFGYRLRAGKKSATGTHAGIAPGKSSVLMGQVQLMQGKNELVVGFDNMNKVVELKEDNNITKPLRVNVIGNCN